MCLFFVKALKQPLMNGPHGCNCFDYSMQTALQLLPKLKGIKITKSQQYASGLELALNELFEQKEHVSLRS